MLEVFILISLCRRIGPLAETKGLSSGWWKFYVVLWWFLVEIISAIIVGMFSTNILLIVVVAYPLAYLSYVLLKKRLESKPDKLADWVDEIGRDTTATL